LGERKELQMNNHRSAVCDGEIVRKAREKFQMSNTQLARYLGVSRGILNRALASETVGFGSIKKIAEKLDVTMEQITGKVQVIPPSDSSKKHSIELEPQLDEKLCRITKELNERYGINDPVCAIRYLIMTYVLTAKVIRND
jgi:transcriptional regulator with XRE-family HTH domain